MNILEKELEDLIYGCIQEDKVSLLRERGLRVVGKYEVFKRQADLGGYGRLDFVGFNFHASNQSFGCRKSLKVGVFEIKKGEINIDTYLQAIRYCKGIEHYIDEKYDWIDPDFEVCLIGTSISKDDFSYLPDYIDNLHIYTTKIDLEKGITFKLERGYRLSQPKLPIGDSQFEGMLFDYMKKKTKHYLLQSEHLPF